MTGSPTPPRRSCARRCLARARGGHAHRRRHGRRAPRGPGRRRAARAAGAPRQQQVARRAAGGFGGGCRPGGRGLVRGDRPHRVTGRRGAPRPPGPRSAHTRRRSPHPRVPFGQDDTKFGFGTASGACRALSRMRNSRARRRLGPTCTSGARCSSPTSFHEAIEVLAPFVVPLDLPEFSIGGGLGVAYVEGETAPASPSGPRW